jgi:uncharacterized membrane protein
MKFGARGLLLLLAVVLFIVGALMDNGDTKTDILYWGLAVFAASFIVESLPLGNIGNRNRS